MLTTGGVHTVQQQQQQQQQNQKCYCMVIKKFDKKHCPYIVSKATCIFESGTACKYSQV